jgi:hypothetical protein
MIKLAFSLRNSEYILIIIFIFPREMYDPECGLLVRRNCMYRLLPQE